jgi:hypothetical protein
MTTRGKQRPVHIANEYRSERCKYIEKVLKNKNDTFLT